MAAQALWLGDRPYAIVFLLLALLLALAMIHRHTGLHDYPKAFTKFQCTFLVVYLTMFSGDWMQASTTYALYASYGFTRPQCGTLFLGGYVVSMLSGPFCGRLADRCGRKRSCLIYAITHMVACAVKHSQDYRVLFLGGAFGGIGTAILWTAFEAWMVSEHRAQGFEEGWLAHTFSLMAMGNFLVAIPSGLVAHAAVLVTQGSLVAPFDIAFLALGAGLVICILTWNENYGDQVGQSLGSMAIAFWTVLGDRKIFLLGLLQSLFEGSMYTFVFLWTPTMTQHGNHIPHGIVFSSFMVACGLGGCLFSQLVHYMPVEALMVPVFLFSAASLAIPVVLTHPVALMCAFCTFELTVGVFCPRWCAWRPPEGRTSPASVPQ